LSRRQSSSRSRLSLSSSRSMCSCNAPMTARISVPCASVPASHLSCRAAMKHFLRDRISPRTCWALACPQRFRGAARRHIPSRPQANPVGQITKPVTDSNPRWLTQQLTHRLLRFSSSAPRAALAKRAVLTNAAWSVDIILPKVLGFRRSQGLSEHRSRRETPQRNRNDLGETTVNKTRRKRPLLEEKSIT
jgi:hypothetical protein